MIFVEWEGVPGLTPRQGRVIAWVCDQHNHLKAIIKDFNDDTQPAFIYAHNLTKIIDTNEPSKKMRRYAKRMLEKAEKETNFSRQNDC